jgi:NAD(P)-dependent dehydrogenase (short-subunit alcohol dehydrogenase family)
VSRTAVITGAAGGLGSATVRRLVAGGWRVYAADLDTPELQALAGERVVAVPVDVTSSSSVAALGDRVRAGTDRVDALVTFAGIVGIGPMVEMTAEDFQRVVDVNVVGTFLAVRELFPLLHVASGRIVLLSSETGWQTAMPFNGPYAMSKHAVEAFGDALRRELALVGVSVVKLQPGAFRTGMVASIMGRFERLAADSEHYQRVLLAARKRVPQEEKRAGDPADLAALVERVLNADRPKAAYRINTNPRAAALSRLPTPVLDRLLNAALKRA